MKRHRPEDGSTVMHSKQSDNPVRKRLMRYGMMACCAVMLLPVAAFFVAGGSVSGHWANAGVFAPLALCVGAHLIMHKLMGKPCHEDTDDEPEKVAVPVPAATRRPVLERQADNHVARPETLEG